MSDLTFLLELMKGEEVVQRDAIAKAEPHGEKVRDMVERLEQLKGWIKTLEKGLAELSTK